MSLIPIDKREVRSCLNSWMLERVKLRKLYFESFKSLSTKHVSELETFFVIHNPTDPDFDSSMLPEGLECVVTVFNHYQENPLADAPSGDSRLCHDDRFNPLAKLQITNEKLDDLVRTAISSIFLDYVHEQWGLHRYVIYEAFKHVDRHLERIFKAAAEKRANNAARIALEPLEVQTWSNDEQRRLEEALVWYRRVKNTADKWKKIGAFVVSKTARQCAQRYKECREQVLNADSSIKNAESEIKDEKGKMEELEAPKYWHIQTAEEEAQGISKGHGTYNHGVDDVTPLYNILLSLSDLNLKSIHLVCMISLRLQVICIRCKHTLDLSMKTMEESLNTKLYGCGKSCDRCHTEVFVNYHPQFSFQNDSRIGSLDLFECALWDVQSGDCKVLCEQCNSETLFRAVKNGTVRDVTCRSCYAKLNFRFDKFATVETRRLQYSDESNTDGNRIENQLQRLNLEKQNTDRRKEKPKSIGVSIKIGTSLPGLGTCKHYKKSHRWLRFPCCLKVFPCDICHDAASDHPHEWARRMICGFCSKEQCYSSKQCSCGHAVTAKRSAFWEGGHGCRNTTFMNKKDNRKYKRPSSKAKVTPQKKKS